jgi:hypothetical protein
MPSRSPTTPATEQRRPVRMPSKRRSEGHKFNLEAHNKRRHAKAPVPTGRGLPQACHQLRQMGDPLLQLAIAATSQPQLRTQPPDDDVLRVLRRRRGGGRPRKLGRASKVRSCCRSWHGMLVDHRGHSCRSGRGILVDRRGHGIGRLGQGLGRAEIRIASYAEQPHHPELMLLTLTMPDRNSDRGRTVKGPRMLRAEAHKSSSMCPPLQNPCPPPARTRDRRRGAPHT